MFLGVGMHLGKALHTFQSKKYMKTAILPNSKDTISSYKIFILAHVSATSKLLFVMI